MSAVPHISYLTRKEINTVKWDNCITNSPNGRIYAYAWYLDHMAQQWDALVVNDYEAVMPLTWKKKYGIKYIYQPFLTAQLGLFGNSLTAELTSTVIKNIPACFKLIEVSLNSGNHIDGADFYFRKNYWLPLQTPYDGLFNAYNSNTQRNCKKAWQNKLTLQKGFSVDRVTELALQQMKTFGSTPPADHLNRFKKLAAELSNRNLAATYGVFQGEKLLSSAVFFFSHNRAYYILVGNHADSKQTGSSHALIDGFIKDNAGTNLILDFEGSDIPGLAAFYAGFGAQLEEYPFLKINRLPLFLKWLKQ